jgi:cellulose synthase operon protein B
MIKTILFVLLLNVPSISLFSQQSTNTIFPLKNDTYLYSPLGQFSFWFQTNQGTKITDSCYIEIAYSNSPMIIPEISFMTLMINDKPVSSININSASDTAVWRINVPADLIAQGFNEVKLNTIQRTSSDPCMDLYNKSNWVKIKNASFFNVSFEKDSIQYISDFPYPFINLLDHNLANCNIKLPANISAEALEIFYKLSSYLGSIKPGNGIYFNLSETDSSQNKIFIGTAADFPGTFSSSVSPGTGALKLVNDSGFTALYISGGDFDGVRKALSALIDNDLRERMDTNEVLITNEFPSSSVFNIGNIPLSELGIKDIKIEGIFDQSEFINLRRPVNMPIGAESYLRLNFKHSANLNPDQSIITALVNGKPSASVRLDQTNTDGGFMDVKIPLDQLDRNEWMIQLACYQDIGNVGLVDCSHLYNESVWTYINSETSELVITNGVNNATPDLKNFPYSFTGGNADSSYILFYLPNDPGNKLLELSAVIASKVGRASGVNENIKVAYGSAAGEMLKNAGSVVFIADQNDNSMWSAISDSLYIRPDGNSFKINSDVKIVNNDLSGTDILQTIKSPWNNGVLYTVMVSGNENTLSLANRLLNEESYSKLEGQVALFKNNGEVISLTTAKVFEPVVEYASFLSQVPSLYWYILAAIIVLAIIFLIMRIFRKKS